MDENNAKRFGTVDLDLDEVDLSQVPLRRLKKDKPTEPQRSTWRQTLVQLKQGALSYLTIKVLLWDVVISGADLFFDFLQGCTLFFTPGKRYYGIVSLAINWLPGLPASIQLMSTYRRSNMACQKVFIWSLILLTCYPIMPFVVFFLILYLKPKPNEQISQGFKDAQIGAVFAHAITGGMESPIQLIYQVWLVLNGIISLDWNQVSGLELTDLYGNRIMLPYTATLCICLSVISILKSIVDFNVQRIQVKSTETWRQFIQVLPTYLEFMPFLIASSFFKIASLIFIMSYLNTFGFIVIVGMLIGNLFINYCCLKDEDEKVPKWLMVFMALFVPVFFTFKESGNLKKEQLRIFNIQAIWSFAVYGITLATIIFLVNTTDSGFHYNPDMILNNHEFNVYIVVIIIMGLISVFLSWRLKRSKRAILGVTPESNVTWSSGLQLVAMLALVSLPLISTPLILGNALEPYQPPSYIYFKPDVNETLIFEAITINPTRNKIEGLLLPLSYSDIKKKALRGIPKNWTKPLTSANHPNNEDYIAAIRKDEWIERKDEVLSAHQPVSVIILDPDEMKPSSPLPAFMINSTMPTFLVGNDSQRYLFDHDQWKQIWISHNYDLIDEPKWKCDDHGTCLQANISKGYIVGNQYRTKTCISRNEMQSTSKQEMLPFCNGEDVQVCPLSREGWSHYYIVNDTRSYRWSPPRLSTPDKHEELFRRCQSQRKWSKWLSWKEEASNFQILQRSKRRYCHLTADDVLLEERWEEKCCLSTAEGDCSKPSCSFAPIIPNE